MYQDGSLGLPGREYLTLKERELERPIRYLEGRGRIWRGTPWTADQAVACGNATVEDCEERGITIVQYSSLHAIVFTMLTVPPSLAYIEDYENYEAYDSVDVADRMPLARPITIADVNFGEVGDRVITLAGSWGHWLDHNVMKADVLLDDALQLCVDEAFITDLTETRATFNRESFLDYVEKTGEEGITQIRDQVDTWAKNLAEYTSYIAHAKLKLREQQRILDAVLQTNEDDATRATRLEQWEMLVNDERIVNLDFSEGKVTIETGPCDLTHPVDGRTVYLGRFRWIFDLNGGEVHVTNLDNQRGGFDHPHVFTNRPCFGDMGETISTFVMQGRLHPAVDMIFVFLGSVQLRDDYGRRAAFWFEQPEQLPVAA